MEVSQEIAYKQTSPKKSAYVKELSKQEHLLSRWICCWLQTLCCCVNSTVVLMNVCFGLEVMVTLLSLLSESELLQVLIYLFILMLKAQVCSGKMDTK